MARTLVHKSYCSNQQGWTDKPFCLESKSFIRRDCRIYQKVIAWLRIRERVLDKTGKILVAGGGGFIGGHLVADFLRRGNTDLRVVDCKPVSEWHQVFREVENVRSDLRELDACRAVTRDARYVFNLPADMAGMGVIQALTPECPLSDL